MNENALIKMKIIGIANKSGLRLLVVGELNMSLYRVGNKKTRKAKEKAEKKIFSSFIIPTTI